MKRQQSALSQAVQILASPLDCHEVVRSLAQIIRVGLKVDVVVLWLRAPHGQEYRGLALAQEPPGAQDSAPDPDLAPLSLHPGESGLQVLSELNQHPWVQEQGLALLQLRLLGPDGSPSGALGVFAHKPRRLSGHELTLLEGFVASATIAVDRLQREESHRQTTEVQEIAHLVASSQNDRESLQVVCRRLARLCRGDRGSLFQWDPKNERMVPCVYELARGEHQQGLWRLLHNLGKHPLDGTSYLRTLVEKAEPVLVKDTGACAEMGSETLEKWPLRSLLAVPLIHRDEVTGALMVDTEHKVRSFTEQDVRLAQAVADQVAFAQQRTRLRHETENRRRQTTAHIKIASSLGSSLELGPLLKEITREAAQACQMDRCSIYLAEGDHLVPKMAQYADGRVDEEMWRKFKQLGGSPAESVSFLDEMIRTREPIIVSDPVSDPMWREPAVLFGTRLIIAVPMIRKEKVIGAILLTNDRQSAPVNRTQIALATTIASQVALAIDNAKLYQETQRRLGETRALLDLAQTIGSSLEPAEIARRTARELARLLDADTALFSEVDAASGHSEVVAGYHLPQRLRDADPHLPPEHRDRFMLDSVDSGLPVAITDVLRDPRFDPEKHPDLPPPRSLLYVPVLSQGRELGGLLSLWWHECHSFTDEELRLAKGIASQMALVLENANNYRQAQRALQELKTAQDRLIQSEKLRALAEMAGGVAHDFNNLLTAILGHSTVLRHWLGPGEVTRDVLASLDTIELAAQDGVQIVRRLLEYTQDPRGCDEMEIVDVNKLLVDTRSVSQHRWKGEDNHREAAVKFQLRPGEAPAVRGNPSELREVLLNLVLNAVDAMPAGGRLTLSSGGEQDWAWIAVEDTGIGMNEEVRRRIFDPFFTTKGAGSSGLGLSASYGIIHRHGGEISVHSRPGRGTRFVLRIPRAGTVAPAP